MKLLEKKSTKQVIEQIHQEFNSASDNLLDQATKILEKAQENDLDKIDRLKAIGFGNVQQVVQAESIIQQKKVSSELANLVQEYKTKYSDYKFITDEQVITICKKYSLVQGPISNFVGFVPAKNLLEIEEFLKVKILNTDCLIELVYNLNVEYSSSNDKLLELRGLVQKLGNIYISQDQVNAYFTDSDALKYLLDLTNYKGLDRYSLRRSIVKQVSPGLSICAPEKDFNTQGLTKKGNIFTKLQHTFTPSSAVPDPVVLYKIRGGNLIVTAWGDESHDPLVKI